MSTEWRRYKNKTKKAMEECMSGYVEPPEGWEERLKPHGYAPGGYINTCIDCEKQTHWIDKRAWRCIECAEKKAKGE